MSNEIVVAQSGGAVAAPYNPAASLPTLVQRASTALANAVGAAEILDARDMSLLAYDAAKAAARLARSRGAYEEVIGAVYRAQADALEIEAQAKRRIADEYDQGRKDGIFAAPTEWREREDVPHGNGLAKDKMTISDLGISRKDMHGFRAVRDAEAAEPGIVGRIAHELAEAGIEPSKRAVSIEMQTRLGSYSGDNEWYTPARYVEMARDVMGTIDVDPASNDHAQKTVNATAYYTAENSGLDKDWRGRLWMNPPYSNPEVQQFTEKAVDEYLSGNVTEAVILTNNSGDTVWHHALAEASAAMCITRGRIRFESPTRASNSPAMGQSFFYLGRNVARFAEVFSEIGRITVNYPVAVARALPGNDNAAAADSAAA